MLHTVSRAAALWVVAASVVAQTPAYTKAEADSLEKKINAIVTRGSETTDGQKPLRTMIVDREVGAYFKFQGAANLPLGVSNPILTMTEAGYLTGSVTVDLDAVRKSKTRSWNDPLNWVSGTVEVRVAGTLRAANGFGSFTLESASLGGVPIPKLVLQEIVTYYTKTPELPGGFNLDEVFTLPQRIVRVEFQRGSAVIVQ